MCIPVGRRSRHLPLSLLSVLCARCERGLWIVIYSTRHFANCIPTCADRFRCGLVVSQSCLHHQTQEEKKNSFFFFFCFVHHGQHTPNADGRILSECLSCKKQQNAACARLCRPRHGDKYAFYSSNLIAITIDSRGAGCHASNTASLTQKSDTTF